MIHKRGLEADGNPLPSLDFWDDFSQEANRLEILEKARALGQIQAGKKFLSNPLHRAVSDSSFIPFDHLQSFLLDRKPQGVRESKGPQHSQWISNQGFLGVCSQFLLMNVFPSARRIDQGAHGGIENIFPWKGHGIYSEIPLAKIFSDIASMEGRKIQLPIFFDSFNHNPPGAEPIVQKEGMTAEPHSQFFCQSFNRLEANHVNIPSGGPSQEEISDDSADEKTLNLEGDAGLINFLNDFDFA